MKILLLAPQPGYQERGTPIAVDLLLRALSQRGEDVDLLAYHEGVTRQYPNVRTHRIPAIPFVKNVGPGPSWKKFVCNIVFFWAALQLAARSRHDLVHAVEESSMMALVIKRLFGIPYVYDMDSSLSEQVLTKYPAARWLAGWLRWGEGRAIRHAEAVVPVCDALAEAAAPYRPRRVVVLRDISLLPLQRGSGAARSRPATEGLAIHGPVAMYVGNLERYQGIDLLLESFALARRRVPQAQLIIVGGSEPALSHYRGRVEALGLRGAAHLIGARPVSELEQLFASADLLVSPRITGGNTPMKLYSYLDSGKAVLATDLPTHTQVLTPAVAALATPEPAPFADAMVRLLEDAPLRQRLSAAAKRLVAERHSFDIFCATVNALYDELAASLASKAHPARPRPLAVESGSGP